MVFGSFCIFFVCAKKINVLWMFFFLFPLGEIFKKKGNSRKEGMGKGRPKIYAVKHGRSPGLFYLDTHTDLSKKKKPKTKNQKLKTKKPKNKKKQKQKQKHSIFISVYFFPIGIYSSWDACQKQVHGFSGAQFKCLLFLLLFLVFMVFVVAFNCCVF